MRIGERRVPVVGWKLERVPEEGEENSWDRLVSERGVYASVDGMRERERRVMNRRGNIGDEARLIVVGVFGFISLALVDIFLLEDMAISGCFYGWGKC